MFRLAVLATALFAISCTSEEREVAVAFDENGGVKATLPDGTTVTSIEEYETAIANQVETIEQMQPLALSITTANDEDGRGVNIGKFKVRLAMDDKYLEGCIRKKFLHLKVLVENMKVPAAIVELHLVAYFDGNKPCLAVMNTGFLGYGWCQKYCVSDPKKAIKATLRGGMIAAGVGATTATIVSILVTPIATAALAI